MTFDAYLRYTRRQSSPQETRAVRAWLADPANAVLAIEWMERYTELLEQEEGPASEMPGFEVMQASLLAKLGLEPAPPKRRWTQWAMAASLAGLLGSSTWYWYAIRSAPTLTSLQTAYGEMRTVRLPDGSTVQLNGHSTLRYAADLNQQYVREVWLDGEGFFAVRHLPTHRRFVVHTDAGFNVEVLGTQFTVYRRHAQARVALVTGKVRIGFADKGRMADVILKPGELLETTDSQPTHVVHKAANLAPYTAWTSHKLVFDETSLADVAVQLSDTYGVPVRLANPSLARYRVSGSFPTGDEEAILQFLEKSFSLTVQRQPQQVVISDH